MKNRKMVAVTVGIAVVALLLGSIGFFVVIPQMSLRSRQDAETKSGIHVNPIDGLSPDFIMGADVSMLDQIEANGGKYSNAGVEQDALTILKNHGVNWIRLRIWNDPTDANGAGLGGGNNDLAKTVALAVRAKGLGLKVLLDFHYSDWWADPGTQTKPKAWVGLKSAQLDQAVYDYTATVIRKLAAAGAMPDMVQIGNEINGGMIWPDGATAPQGNEKIGGYDGLAALLNEGIRAVRDNDPNNANPEKRTRIMIHLANGGDNKLYRTVFDALTARKVDFDVIGLSYYSYWHGPLDQFEGNMIDISNRYHKDVVVAETAYAFTLDNADDLANLFGENEQSTGGYVASVQGQATAIRDVMAAVAQVPNGRGLGVFYWEPDWIAVKGAGWKTGDGDAWDNQALFDFKGNALASMNVFDFVRPEYGGISIAATLARIIPSQISTSIGAQPVLPTTVQAVYSDDSIRNIPVAWEPIDPSKLEKADSFSVAGKAAGTDARAIANVSVSGERNFVENPSFETGSLSPWTVQGSTAAVDISQEAGNMHTGTFALHYWMNGPFAFTASQAITGLANGTYTLSAWIQGGGGESTLQLFADGCGADARTADIQDDGWQKWKNPTIDDLVVTTGGCTIGLKVASDGGNWAFMDDVKLVLKNK